MREFQTRQMFIKIKRERNNLKVNNKRKMNKKIKAKEISNFLNSCFFLEIIFDYFLFFVFGYIINSKVN